MQGLFKGAKVIGHYKEGGYGGLVCTCVQLEDGRFALYNDYYGSCSGCDSWEDASDEEVNALCINLSNGAYIFQSLSDVEEYLNSVIDDPDNPDISWDWRDVAEPLLMEIHKSYEMR